MAEVWLLCSYKRYLLPCLVSQFGADVLAVQTSDVGDRLVLGANGLTCTGIGAVSEAQFVHLGYHRLCTLSSLWSSLWQKCQLAYF